MHTKVIQIGDRKIGGGNPIAIQSMTNTKTEDVKATVEQILRLEKAGCECKQIEGYQNANWILMDYKDVIVHIFCREDRLFYDLERIWRDGKTFVDVNEID